MKNRPSGRSDSERYGDMFKDGIKAGRGGAGAEKQRPCGAARDRARFCQLLPVRTGHAAGEKEAATCGFARVGRGLFYPECCQRRGIGHSRRRLPHEAENRSGTDGDQPERPVRPFRGWRLYVWTGLDKQGFHQANVLDQPYFVHTGNRNTSFKRRCIKCMKHRKTRADCPLEGFWTSLL